MIEDSRSDSKAWVQTVEKTIHHHITTENEE